MNFTKVYKEQYAIYGRDKKTVEETIHICKGKDILKEYLTDREKEVTDIMTTLFDEETILKAYLKEEKEESRNEGRKEGRKEGLSFGRISGQRDMALNLSDMGMPLEQIASAASLS